MLLLPRRRGLARGKLQHVQVRPPRCVPVKIGGFLGIGGEDAEEKCSVCWNDPAKKPGVIQCSRCKGTKYIYFRNADWR